MRSTAEEEKSQIRVLTGLEGPEAMSLIQLANDQDVRVLWAPWWGALDSRATRNARKPYLTIGGPLGRRSLAIATHELGHLACRHGRTRELKLADEIEAWDWAAEQIEFDEDSRRLAASCLLARLCSAVLYDEEPLPGPSSPVWSWLRPGIELDQDVAETISDRLFEIGLTEEASVGEVVVALAQREAFEEAASRVV